MVANWLHQNQTLISAGTNAGRLHCRCIGLFGPITCGPLLQGSASTGRSRTTGTRCSLPLSQNFFYQHGSSGPSSWKEAKKIQKEQLAKTYDVMIENLKPKEETKYLDSYGVPYEYFVFGLTGLKQRFLAAFWCRPCSYWIGACLSWLVGMFIKAPALLGVIAVTHCLPLSQNAGHKGKSTKVLEAGRRIRVTLT
jgi:hypothetical protein